MERKISSKIENGMLTLQIGEHSLTISVEEIAEEVRDDLLLFAIRQKITNATGGKDVAEALKIARSIIERSKDGSLTAKRPASGISKEARSVASRLDGLPPEKRAEALELLEQLIGAGFGGR